MLLYTLISGVFCLILIGFLFLAILWVLNAVFVIIAAIQASEGKILSLPDDHSLHPVTQSLPAQLSVFRVSLKPERKLRAVHLADDRPHRHFAKL